MAGEGLALIIFLGVILGLAGFALIGGSEWQMGLFFIFFGAVLFFGGLTAIRTPI